MASAIVELQWEKQLLQISEHLGSHTGDHYLLSTAHLVPLHNGLHSGAKGSGMVPASLLGQFYTHVCQIPFRNGLSGSGR